MLKGGSSTLKRIEASSLIDEKLEITEVFKAERMFFGVVEDKEGNLWVGTAGGLNLLDRRTGKFQRFKPNPEDTKAKLSDHVWKIFEDSQGNLLISANRSLLKFDRQQKQFIKLKPKDAHTQALHNFRRTHLFEYEWALSKSQYETVRTSLEKETQNPDNELIKTEIEMLRELVEAAEKGSQRGGGQ